MKACPAPRSGIDRSGSLSFAIRGIPSSIRPPNRHSGEGRNPEGVGRGKATRRWKKLTRRPIFSLLCGLRKAMVIPAFAGIQGRRRGGTNDAQTLPATRPPFSYLGVPATARMSDWYENGVTRPQVCLNATGPRFVILAEAGIQRGGAAPTTPKHFQRPGLIFIPWRAGTSRHERLVRKHVPDSDPGWMVPVTTVGLVVPASVGIPSHSSFVPKYALQSTSMPALHRRNVPNCRLTDDGGMRKCSAGACPPLGSGWDTAESAAPIRCTKSLLRVFIPWCAGASRHERLVLK